MNDIITVCGIVATEPRHLVTETGIAITSLRLASPSRRWDRASAAWVNGATNWYTVTAFRSLASNVFKSLKKGDRIVVSGRVRIRTWERDGRGGTSVEIDADGIGHDLAWGISNWVRVPRQVNDTTSGHGGVRGVDPRTGEVHGGGLGAAPALDGPRHEHDTEHEAEAGAGAHREDEDAAGTDHGTGAGIDDGLDEADPVGPSERMLEQDGAAFDPESPDDDGPLARVAA
ncbi:single-stranded DNA-binding protein [Curtobacterium sp. VKM Ac-2861]|uniref:single-stranded DNA-binding protein n=1 Tax=unclassified Curtobacterium TaxID=257496 RepID=UPI000F48A340|nr:single-stranded DNA-binding protein [Curtobacterium sp. PhB78]NQW91012.1 single-stranded DNA-binding protein [Curtobacterium sp. VKM Ac-2861]ROS35332.1 single-strand DNA-binding protein [Curtobacterium sp. PhB78]